MSKILVTGGNGFIGNNLVRYLIDKGNSVTIIDNFSESPVDWVDNHANFYSEDIRDLDILKQIFKIENFEYVFHCAADANECRSHWTRNNCISNNVIGTTNIINCCVEFNVEKIIGFSSIAVMGEGNPPFKETDEPNPIDIYGWTKFFNEKDYELANKIFGLRYSIVRPYNVTGGKYQNLFSLYRNVIAIWLRKIIWEDGKLPIFGQGDCERNFSHVKFLLPCLEKLMNCGDGEIFNIGSEKTFTVLEAAKLVQSVAKKYGYDSELLFLEPRNEVKRAFSDIAKAKQILDFKDETNLEETIDEMFQWALTEKYREPKKFNYELTKNLYSFWT